MNRWSKIHTPGSKGANRGLSRQVAELKRTEAEARNAATPHDRTRAHRLGRCDCE